MINIISINSNIAINQNDFKGLIVRDRSRSTTTYYEDNRAHKFSGYELVLLYGDNKEEVIHRYYSEIWVTMEYYVYLYEFTDPCERGLISLSVKDRDWIDSFIRSVTDSLSSLDKEDARYTEKRNILVETFLIKLKRYIQVDRWENRNDY